MKSKISVIVIIALLILSVGAQKVVAGGNSVSTDSRVSVTIISLTQELNYQDPVIFEKEKVEYTTMNGRTALKLEDAGSINIDTNIAWRLFAQISNLDDVQIYIRVRNDGKRSWLPVNNEPVMVSSAPGEFNFSWDVMVVADDYKGLQDFEINFVLQPR